MSSRRAPSTSTSEDKEVITISTASVFVAMVASAFLDNALDATFEYFYPEPSQSTALTLLWVRWSLVVAMVFLAIYLTNILATHEDNMLNTLRALKPLSSSKRLPSHPPTAGAPQPAWYRKALQQQQQHQPFPS